MKPFGVRRQRLPFWTQRSFLASFSSTFCSGSNGRRNDFVYSPSSMPSTVRRRSIRYSPARSRSGIVSHSERMTPFVFTPSRYFCRSAWMVNRLPAKSDAAQGPNPRYSSPVQYFMLCRQMKPSFAKFEISYW